MQRLPPIGKLTIATQPVWRGAHDPSSGSNSYYELTEVSQATTQFGEINSYYQLITQLHAVRSGVIDLLNKSKYLYSAVREQIDDLKALSRNNIKLYRWAAQKQ